MAKNMRLLAMFAIASTLGLYLAYRERHNRDSAMANAAPITSPVSPAPAAPADPEPPAAAQAKSDPPLRPSPEDIIRPATPIRPSPEDIIRPASPIRPQPSDRAAAPATEYKPAPGTEITRPRDN